MSISNDVFGLTIHQFEKEFKACLERRKQNSQMILHFRYPIKSSNEYREYLENCTGHEESHDEGRVFWSGNSFFAIYLYEQLVKLVGSEIDIRHRQRLLLVHDKIANMLCKNYELRQISSGSLSEGLNLPGSDFDVMFVIDYVESFNRIQNIRYPTKYTTLLIETDRAHPGFSRLKLVDENYNGYFNLIKRSVIETNDGLYLEPHKFIENIQKKHKCGYMNQHGPCLSDKMQVVDYAFCLHSKAFPFIARRWVYRHRKQWPPNVVINTIMRFGCLLVPIGPKTISNNQFLWRVSFSVAEKQLVHSFNYTQFLCYGLFKLTLKKVINKIHVVEDLLCSYVFKTTLFWVSEESSIQIFQLPNLFYCFSLCLYKLRSWILNCYCPNFFIHEQNMFLGKINKTNNTIMLRVIDNIICRGLVGLVSSLFVGCACNSSRAPSEKCTSIDLDILLHKVLGTHVGNPKNALDSHQGIVNVKYLLSQNRLCMFVLYVDGGSQDSVSF